MPPRNGILLLAGGAGTRLGMVNKALLDFGGKPLIWWVADKALKVSSLMVVSLASKADREAYRRLLPAEVEFVYDERSGLGPLEGIRVGLKRLGELGAFYALTLACDLPFLNPSALRFLLDEAWRLGVDALVPRWPNGFTEALHAVYKVRPMAEAAEEALARGERLILNAVKRLSKVYFLPVERLKPFDPKLSTFTNINTYEDLREALSRLKHKGG